MPAIAILFAGITRKEYAVVVPKAGNPLPSKAVCGIDTKGLKPQQHTLGPLLQMHD